ncbi:hypothetical protein ANANG_G00065110 [Anguilla anguilla]|uniref:Uncharacterized protein n=1 Tax=Anguilla anguilla TaxID=7936 RepID=A0A9D3S2U7_ANGAN|nr:hypothetical protein ANANG_G00065110 [Anguilla anguilla]
MSCERLTIPQHLHQQNVLYQVKALTKKGRQAGRGGASHVTQLRVLAKKKITPEATSRNPATEAMAIPTTNGSDTYSSQCSPRWHPGQG